MFTKRKIILTSIVVIIFGIIMLKIFANKKQMDDELKSMQEFNRIVPVEIYQVKSEKVFQDFEEYGKFRSNNEVTVLSETQGKILSFDLKNGDFVSKGKIIAVVEKEVLESQYESAKFNLEKTESDLKRYKSLTQGEAVTQQQLENANSNYQNALAAFVNIKKQLDNTNIKASISGVVSNILCSKGSFLFPNSPVIAISEINPMILSVKVSEDKLIDIKKETLVNIKIDVFPEMLIKGSIKSIGVNPDLANRYEIEITTPNINNSIRPGMDGKAEFIFKDDENHLVIPRKCIIGSIETPQVFIIDNNNLVSIKDIQVSNVNDKVLSVKSGLSDGDKVVLSGQINLQNGKQVKIINK